MNQPRLNFKYPDNVPLQGPIPALFFHCGPCLSTIALATVDRPTLPVYPAARSFTWEFKVSPRARRSPDESDVVSLAPDCSKGVSGGGRMKAGLRGAKRTRRNATLTTFCRTTMSRPVAPSRARIHAQLFCRLPSAKNMSPMRKINSFFLILRCFRISCTSQLLTNKCEANGKKRGEAPP